MSISDSQPSMAEADAIVIGVLPGPGGPVLAPGSAEIDEALDSSLAATLAALGATGKPEEVTKIATGGRLSAPLIAAVGLGGEPDSPAGPETLRRAAGAAVRALLDGQAGARGLRIALALPARDAAQAEAVALGGLLGSYSFSRYRHGGPGSTTLTLVGASPEAAGATRRAEVLAAAVTLARDLVNTPPSDLVPTALAAEAERVAAACGLDAEVLDEKALAEQGYGGILGVGQGSVHPPRLVRLEYASGGQGRHSGPWFSRARASRSTPAGCRSSRPGPMETMKSDMAGAAATLGALQAISELRPSVHGSSATCRSPRTCRAGPLSAPPTCSPCTGASTVEVLNTDAEGRLVLADALARSAEDSPRPARRCRYSDRGPAGGARPHGSATVMANDDAVRGRPSWCGRPGGRESCGRCRCPTSSGRAWTRPLADLANVAADRYGGMLVGRALPARVRAPAESAGHIWTSQARPSMTAQHHGYTPKGGTGAATRTLVQIALDVADGRL